MTEPRLDPRDDHSRPTLTATRGLPASGKTTWALNQLDTDHTRQLTRCNRDDLRRMIHGKPRYDSTSEHLISVIQDTVISTLLLMGLSVLVDDTNLDHEHLANLQHLAHNHGARFTIEDFRHVPLDTCIERDKHRMTTLRGGYVGESVIRKMYDRHLGPPPSTREPT